ncbi:MAG: YibE/F family protein [Clostridiales Family XIII bacterium]|jgi:uncharacterized membrane protein|nr:YibE/F family protein [Clostridiales Family XIII bacterium]
MKTHLSINNIKRRAPHIMWGALALLFTVFLILFNSTLEYPAPADIQTGNRYEKAEVTKILNDSLAPDPDFPEINIGVQELELRVLTGESKGKLFIANNFVTRLDNKSAEVGTKMVVSSYDGFVSGLVMDYSRENFLYVLGLIFVATLAVFGGVKGVKAFLALAFTLVIVIFMFVPMLLRGVEPVIAAVVTVVLSTVVTMASLNGWSRKTIAAASGCIICTFLAGGIALAIGALTHVSTYTTAEAEHLIFIAQRTGLKLHDILFAGIIIASSGAVMDTSISIASAMAEVRELEPDFSAAALLRSGLNVGRDVMGTMANTLILAFTGSSINTVLIIFMYQMPYIRLINLSSLAVEILCGLSGSIGLILSVPVTAALAARLMPPASPPLRQEFFS